MLERIRSLINGTAEAPEPTPLARPNDPNFVRLNKVAQLVTVDDAAGSPQSLPPMSLHVLREAVLGRDERIAGYEFSLDRQRRRRFKERGAVGRKVYDETLMREFSALQVDRLLDYRLALVEVAMASVAKVLESGLPKANTVVILETIDGGTPDDQVVFASIDALVSAGLRVCWKFRSAAEAAMPILARCQFVQISAPDFDGVQLKDFVRNLRRLHGPDGTTPILLIARDVQTSDDFQLCFRAGFDYFQGPFVSSRGNWSTRKSEVDRLRVMRIIKLLRDGADNAVLAEEFQREPVLTFKLLCYVHSAATGVQIEIGTIHQALLAIDRQKLYRWLSLLVFDIKDRGFAERVLIEQALVRARMMALLSVGSLNPDCAFLIGLFSLHDQVMGLPIEDLLAQINLTAEVRDALLTQTGPYANLLELAKACERGDPTLISVTADKCALAETFVDAQLIAANNWVYATVSTTE